MHYILLATFLWATSFPSITHGIEYVSPFTFALLRFVFALLVFLPFALGKVDPKAMLSDRMLVFVSLVNALGYVLQFKAQSLTTASKTALFINTAPIFTALIETFVLGKPFDRFKFASLVFVMLGVFMISTHMDPSKIGSINVGDLLNLIAAMVWAVFVVSSRSVVEKHNEYTFNLALYFWAVVLILPFALLEEVRFHPTGLVHSLYLAVFCTILAYMLYSKALRYVSAFTIVITFTLEIVLATLISFVLLGERFTLIEGIGATFVIVGIALSRLSNDS